MTFIADLSLPDGSTVSAGVSVTKTWRVRNDGTCTWNSNYTFRQIGGDALTATTIQAPIVGSGQIADISVTVTVGTDLANYDALERATFRMYNASGIAFGDSPYVELAIQPATSTCSDSMTITSSPATTGLLSAGQILPVTWTILNSGTCTWQNYSIERLGSGSPLLASNLPLTLPTVAPNQSYTLTVNAQIATTGNPISGLYTMSMVLLNGNDNIVGTTFIYQAEYNNGTACIWDSDFVSDITIPDGTVVNIGQTFTKTWRLENSGTCPWDNFSLHIIEDADDVYDIVGVNNVVTVPFVAPGNEVDLSVTLVLDSNASPGETYRARFQIMGVGNIFFGTMPYVEVEAGLN